MARRNSGRDVDATGGRWHRPGRSLRTQALAAGDSSGVLDRSLAGFDLYLAGSTGQAGKALATLEWEEAEQWLPTALLIQR